MYVTSKQLHPTVVDYYLALLTGVPSSHARNRLVLLDCNDASAVCLSEKILRRPRLMSRIRQEIMDIERSHMVCFNSTSFERSLAVRLGIPLNSVDPLLQDLGTKSGCREVFRAAGIQLPFGFERLSTVDDMARALAAIYQRDPSATRAVVKLNEGFSGEGNALFYYGQLDPNDPGLHQAILDQLPTDLRFEAPAESWDTFAQKFAEMAGVVETFVEGKNKQSPSAQARVNAIGQAQVISTHDQVLGGPSGQVFLGRGRDVPARHPGIVREGIRRAGEARGHGSVRHRLRLGAQQEGVGALRHRDQPPQGGHHPPLPHPEVPHSRGIQPGGRAVLRAVRKTQVLLRLRHHPGVPLSRVVAR
ncbi:MAG: hypothetical protein JRI25_29900 [Deltaproteobacteria bacterium]|nr:hypothetical protein [Deltaproteobacteria bacterium]